MVAKKKAAKKAPAKKKPAAKKEVATKAAGGTLAIPAGDVGGGMEGTDKDSFAIPFLRVLQKGSPQCDEADPASFMEEARPGMFFNSVTSELYKSVTFIPCAYQRRFIRWGARSGPSPGFKAEFLPEDAAELQQNGAVVMEENRWLFPGDKGELNPKKQDVLKDTRNHFGLILDEEGMPIQVLLSLTSTQIKKSKQMMSILGNAKMKQGGKNVTPPTWMNQIQLDSIPESNDQGSWHGIKLTPSGFIDSQTLYDAGKTFHTAILGGEAKVIYTDDEATKDTSAI